MDNKERVKVFRKGQRVKLSPNFYSDEFDCHCKRQDCDETYINMDLISYLQEKRDKIGKPIKIISGFRCSTHNKNKGGAIASRHLIGQAADISVDGMTMTALGGICSDAGGLGIGDNFVHVDIRSKKARWRY